MNTVEGRSNNRDDGKISSQTSSVDGFVSNMDGLRSGNYKKIRRLSAGSKLSSYYYIGAELRVCADCVKKSSSRPLLRDIIDRKTGEPKILKIISKSRIPPGIDSLNNWRTLCEKLLNMPNMPNLMRIDQIWESETSFYIVTEKFIGGELFEYLLKEKAIPEDICKYIFRQILNAVDTLHSMNLLHRDIKPENIMFRNPTKSILPIQERYELALIDFDTCKMTDRNNDKSEIVNGKRRLVGTYGYLAPEILRGDEYSTASDLWSVGIVLYILMTGIPPISMDKMYDAKASHAILAAAEANGIDFNTPPLIEFPLARDLCKRLLSFDKNRRISSANDALAHPWLAGLPNIFDCTLRLHSNQHRQKLYKDSKQDKKDDMGKKEGSGGKYESGGNFNKNGVNGAKKCNEGYNLLNSQESLKYYGLNAHTIRGTTNDMKPSCVDDIYSPLLSQISSPMLSQLSTPIVTSQNKTSIIRNDDLNILHEDKKRRIDNYTFSKDDLHLKTIAHTTNGLLQSLTTNAESIDGTLKKSLRRRLDIQT